MSNHAVLKMNADTGAKGKVFLWVLLVCLFLAVLPGSVFAQANLPPVQTIKNPAGTTISLFDYSVFTLDGDQTNRIQANGAAALTMNDDRLDTGINQNHRFKFIKDHWNLPVNNAQNRRWYWLKEEPHWMNFFTGSANPPDNNPAYADSTHGVPNQGIVELCLTSGCATTAHGYPQLNDDTAGGEPLTYLFTTENRNYYNYDNDDNLKRVVYPKVDNLLMVDENGYYKFDSNYEKAQLKITDDCQANGGCEFDVRLANPWDGLMTVRPTVAVNLM